MLLNEWYKMRQAISNKIFPEDTVFKNRFPVSEKFLLFAQVERYMGSCFIPM